METERQIRLRYPATCTRCQARLERRATAWWNSTARTARCMSCDDSPRPVDDDIGPAEPLVTGDAGRSARREWTARRQRREERIRARFPRIGGLILALTGDPQSTSAWKKGAEGERILGERLDGLADHGVIVLHDRLIPRSGANIDHLAIAPAGVFVIDAKHYAGKVEKRDVGRFFRSDVRLWVGGRDRTALLAGVDQQVSVVREALDPVDAESVPVHGVLCFVRGDWSLFARPMRFDEVTVTWPRELEKRIRADGALTQADIGRLGRALAERLRPGV